MKKFVALVLVALMLFAGLSEAAKTKVVVKNRGNKNVVKVVNRGRGANAAQVNVNVNANAGHARAQVINRGHVGVSHAGFAVFNHHHNRFAFANHGYGYHNNVSVYQPVTFAVASPLTIATVPVDIINAPATAVAADPCQTATVTTGVTNTYGYAAKQAIVGATVIKTVNVPLNVVGVKAGY